MNSLRDLKIHYEPDSLESLFPMGIFSDKTDGNRQVLTTIRTIESLILQNVNFNSLLAKISLLQAFPRQIKFDEELEIFFKDFEDYSDFIKKFAIKLCPDTLEEFINMLSIDETEVFLKNYLLGHDTWGTLEGMVNLVRTMLESCTHHSIPVRAITMNNNFIRLGENRRSLLGKQFSNLGSDFTAGKQFLSRPKYYKIDIGPIFYVTLEKFQEYGWADELEASEKLKKLAGLAEPYYMDSKINIILATQGFKLGESIIGNDSLGVAYTMTDE